MQKRVNKLFELGVSIFLLLGAIYMEYIAFTTDKPATDGNLTAMAFPKVLYIVIIALCFYMVVTDFIWLKNNPAEKDGEKIPVIPMKSLVTFGMIVLYALSWKYIGFTIGTFIFFLVESRYLSKKHPLWMTVLLALILTVFMYVVFAIFFKVSFPDPLMNAIRGI